MLQRQHKDSLENNPKPQTYEPHSLDSEYLIMQDEILSSPFMNESASKHVRIRIEAWLEKLCLITSNTLWKRNRNNYIKLINLICQCEVVVDPFLSLPPEGDLAKLSKHKINSIIDAVEREVKICSRQSRQSYRSSKGGDHMSQQSQLSINQEIQRENYSSFQQNEESCFLKERFAHTAEVNHKSISFDVEKGVFFSTAQSVKSFKASQTKDKQIIKTPNESNHAINSKFSKVPPKHITVKINTPISQVELPQTFVHKQSISGCLQSGSINTSNYMNDIDEQSLSQSHNRENEAQNNTLNTELFDQDFPPQDHNFDQDCDFSGQISERCREKDEILSQTYFSWKKQRPSSMFNKQPIKFSALIPSRPLQFDSSPSINASFQSIDHTYAQNQQDEYPFEESKTIDGVLLKDITDSIHNLVE